MNSLPARILGVVVLSNAMLGCSDADPAAALAPSGSMTPEARNETLAIVPCRYVVPKSQEGTAFRCADLPVPENRATTDGAGRSITIHVIVFNGKQGGVPTIFLQGGPGGSAEEDATGLSIEDPSFVGRHKKFLDQGDLVFFDQRGVGRSIPRLTCVPEEGSSDPDPAAKCFARLKATGVDFAAYDSASSADDVHDLRVALGVKQVNIHGISYGSRLALEMLRRHPEDVRAAVIDGVLPTQTKVFTDTMPNLDATITKIFAACASDTKCNSTYPDLDGAFKKLKTKLDATPFGSGGNTFDWPTFEQTVFSTLYSPVAAGQLPYFIHSLLAQTQAEWAADQNAKADRFNKEEKARTDALKATPLGKEVYARLDGKEGTLSREIIGDLAFAMYAAVSCADSGQYETLDEALRALDNVRPELRAFGEAEARSAFAACRTLPAIAPKSPATIASVESSVPTLVIGGELDPITPSKNAELVATTLSNNQLVVVPGGAHGLNDECGTNIKTGFVLTTKPVDASCATSHRVSFYYK
jgi:pimeloyl-ACP methyl ester carboxylesterase